MRYTVISILTAVLLLAGAEDSIATIALGPIHNPANGHDYYLLNPASWSASETEAVSLGGHLVTINDAAENAFVTSTFTDRALWIGFTDSAVEGTFVWISGEPPTFTNWVGGEPNNVTGQDAGGEDYTALFSPGGQWIDIVNSPGPYYGSPVIYGVVEIASVPEPTPILLVGMGILLGVLASRLHSRKVFTRAPFRLVFRSVGKVLLPNS